MPTAQLSLKLWHESPISWADISTLYAITGLNTFSWNWPWVPETDTATSFPITWAQAIVIASHWVGLTLPGIIELPGSLAGKTISPMPVRGPLASIRMLLAMCIRLTATRLRRATNLHHRVVRRERFKLVLRERSQRDGRLIQRFLPPPFQQYPGGVLSPGTNSRSPQCELAQCVSKTVP